MSIPVTLPIHSFRVFSATCRAVQTNTDGLNFAPLWLRERATVVLFSTPELFNKP
jgi:hypothetical protein